MIVYYISPSVIPSRTANSVHVLNMCKALSKDNKILLFAKRTIKNRIKFKEDLLCYYDDIKNIKTITFFSKIEKANNIRIALLAIFYLIKSFFNGLKPDIIISRNLYASFFIGVVLRRKIIFETHQPEKGIKMILQHSIMKSKNVKTVIISYALLNIFKNKNINLVKKCIVLHDAAQSGMKLISKDLKNKRRFSLISAKINDYPKLVGYFGHLYKGRGIDIIKGLAKEFSNVAFLVYGGNEEDIRKLEDDNEYRNLFIMGYIKPIEVRNYMVLMDVLLMPYQKSVSVEISGLDTSKWMSPMKMFEYMASGVPIISSKLKVLEEVLEHEYNAMLAAPDNLEEWVICLDKLLCDNKISNNISKNAYKDYFKSYTWEKRAKKILEFDNV